MFKGLQDYLMDSFQIEEPGASGEVSIADFYNILLELEEMVEIADAGDVFKIDDREKKF